MLEIVIRKHVLKNIYDYGIANPGSVIGKVIADYPEAKNNVKNAINLIIQEINRASKLSKEQIAKEMEEFTYIQKVEKEKVIALPNVSSAVVTRFPPEPSGYPHIGHAKAAWLDYEGAKNHNGIMVLRFDDTNPEKEKQEFVESIMQGLNWLGISWDKLSYTSDNMPIVYEAAKKLILKGKAYVSIASQEDVRKSRTNGNAVPDRENTVDQNLDNWEKMLNGKFQPGEATLLFKGNLKAENTTLRDPTLARIILTPHYRAQNKYRVWPSYDLAVVVMDHIEGITHSMRSKEYELRDELYKEICKALIWDTPELVGFSRLTIKNAPISKRLITPLVNEKKVSGWDDPRLPTLAGLRRRGILPGAIKEFVLNFGLSKVESEPDWDGLLAINRKLLDPISPHYFFVKNPVFINTDLSPKLLSLKKHPKVDLGEREIQINEKVYIDGSDFENIGIGEIFRLKDLCNIQLQGNSIGKVVEESQVKKKIQWVTDPISCKILIPKDLLNNEEFDPNSLEEIQGLCEKAVQTLEIGSIIQFERFGFCRLDCLDPLTLIYSC